MGRKDITIPAAFKYVRTSKDHACEGCQRIIKKGYMSLNVHGRVGIWFNEYWCWGCDLDRIASIPDSNLRNKLYKEKAELQVSGQFLPQKKEPSNGAIRNVTKTIQSHVGRTDQGT